MALYHKLLRIDSRDRSDPSDSPSDFEVHFNSIPSARVANIGLISFSLMNTIGNITSLNNKFIVGRENGLFAARSAAELTFAIELQNVTGDSFILQTAFTAVDGTIAAKAVELKAFIDAAIIGTSTLTVTVPDSRLNVTLSAGTFRFVKSLTSTFMQTFLGLSQEQFTPSQMLETDTLPGIFGNFQYTVTPGQYTATEFMTHLSTIVQTGLTAEGAGSTFVAALNVDNDTVFTTVGETFNYPGKDSGQFYLWQQLGLTQGSPSSAVLTYTTNSTVNFSGINLIYLHCQQISDNQCIVSTGNKQTESIHAAIPVNVAYGEMINYESSSRHFWNVDLSSSSSSLRTLRFSLRDSQDNVLEVNNFDEVTMLFDMDIVGI